MKKIITALLLFITYPAFAQTYENGLVGYYSFSGNANDESGNAYNGNVNGAKLVSDRFGNKKSAFSFDGEDDYIDLSQYAESFNFKEPATVSFWIKSESDAAQSIFSISDSTENIYGILSLFIGNFTTSTLADELICCANRRNAGDDYITGYTTTNRSILLDNNWHHLVFVFDAEFTHIYLDNNELPLTDYKTNNGHFGNFQNANKVLIGTRYSNEKGAFFNGLLDELRIYNRPLEQVEISKLFHENATYFHSIIDTGALIITLDSIENEYEQYPPTIKIYPNDEKDQIYIDSQEQFFGYELRIVNSLNKIVMKKTIKQFLYLVDLNSWTGKGKYFVQIFDLQGKMIDVKKLILE